MPEDSGKKTSVSVSRDSIVEGVAVGRGASEPLLARR